jgi:hypothetical protein
VDCTIVKELARAVNLDSVAAHGIDGCIDVCAP